MGKKRREEQEVKTRKFRVTFEVEVAEEKLSGLADKQAVLDKVESEVESHWDGGVNDTVDFIEDSYGFEVEEI